MPPIIYEHLDANDLLAIEGSLVPSQSTPSSDPGLRTMWEKDHYAHSVLLTTCTDPECQQKHMDAMAAIETALAGDPP